MEIRLSKNSGGAAFSTYAFWLELARFLLKSNIEDQAGLLESRCTPGALREVWGMQLAVLITDCLQPIGFAALWPQGGNCYEWGGVWVHSRHRHRGLGRRLYEEGSELAKSLPPGSIIFGITENDRSVALGEILRLKMVDWSGNHGVPWDIACAVCDKVAPESIGSGYQTSKCPKRGTTSGTCRLRVFKTGEE